MRSKTASSFHDDIARIQSRVAIESEARGARIISLFGLDRSAGVTTVAAALARGLAAQSLPVVLVDADTATPAVHQFFRVPQTPGVAELLASPSPTTGAVRESGVGNLGIVPAGTWSAPSQAVLSERWRRMLAPFRDSGGMVIVDAGKATSVNADAIARASDGVVLVIESGRDTREQVVAFAAHMDEIGVPCLGLVLNKRRRRTQRDAA